MIPTNDVDDPSWKIGTVKWFNDAKGYGFILSEDGSKDVFVRYDKIQSDGFRSLRPGMVVRYRAVETGKGAHAQQVQPVLP